MDWKVFDMDELSRFYRSRIFEIPSQQRPYSWTTNQIKDLLLDLKISHKRRTHHYCGPIFLENTILPNGQQKPNLFDNHGAQLIHYNILDGQQRVTSIILVATALTKHPYMQAEINQGNGRAIGLHAELCELISYVSVGNATHDTPRMNFNNREMDDMMGWLMFQNPPNEPAATTAGVERLKSNYTFIEDNINRLCEIQTHNDLIVIGNHFLTGMKVILVEMGPHNFNKYTVFESINNRGLNLSEFDKIKNLFLHIAEQHEDRAQNNGVPPTITPASIEREWYATIQTLYEFDLLEEEEKCITDLWGVIYQKTNLNSDQIFNLVKEKFEVLVDNDDPVLMPQLVRFYQNWNNYTTSYCKIYTTVPGLKLSLANMNGTGQENLERILYQIELPQVFRMPLTCAMMLYNQQEFGEVSVFFEKALMRIHGMKTKRQISGVNAPLTRIANSIFNGLNPLGCKRAICHLVAEHAPLSEVVKNLLKGYDIYNKGWRGNSLYYFLYRIDLHLNLGAGHGVPIVFPSEASNRKVQIEHIMPRSHRAHWGHSWPIEEVADRWLHRIGNLTLTTDQASNNQLGNKSIEDKCIGNYPNHTYTHGRLIEQLLPPIATKFQATHEWEKLEILANELGYAKFFISLWSLPCDCDLEGIIVLDDATAQINDEKQLRFDDYVIDNEVVTFNPYELVDFDEEIITCQHDEEE
jgi:hypothetical protein